MKSAWERALEKLEDQGISAPRQDVLSDDQRRRIDEVRRRHEASVAELEILHRRTSAADPAARIKDEENYRRELRRHADRMEADIDRIRRG